MATETTPTWQPPQPLPAPVSDFHELTLDDIPQIARPFLQDITLRLQCPLEYAAAPFIVGFSSLVGRRLALRVYEHDDSLTVPNLWGAVVGPSASMTTAAFRRALAPLQELQDDRFAKYRRAVRRIGNRKRYHGLIRPKRLPRCRRFIASDATLEKLADLLCENPAGLLVYRDDLGTWLHAMTRSRHQRAREFFCQAHDGDAPITFDRVTRDTVHVPAICLSVFGGIEPCALELLLADSKAVAPLDHGFVNRLQILFWPDVPADWRFFDSPPPPEYTLGLKALFQRIASGDALPGDLLRDKNKRLRFVHLTPAARELYRDWRADLENTLRRADLSPSLLSHRARYRSLVPSLALLLRVLDRGVGDVDQPDFALALRWEKVLWSHAQRVYGSVPQDTPARRLLRKLLGDRNRWQSFDRRDVLRCHWSGLKDHDALSRALITLQDAGHIRASHVTAHGQALRYELNPLAEIDDDLAGGPRLG